MSQIDKYEAYRTIIFLIINTSTLVGEIFLCINFNLITALAIGLVGYSLIILSFKICDKKIEKYEKELSQESSQL